jgi:hypothetical protein
MATTIMISTKVKPALRMFLFVFIYSSFPIRGVNGTAGGLYMITFSFTGLPAATTMYSV